MPPIIRIKTAFLRRFVLLILFPIFLMLFFFIHLGRGMADMLSELRIMFVSVWKGEEEEGLMLPCPFCGGKGDPDGWRTQGGATGPSCTRCGATTWSLETWNTRIELPPGTVKK